ncbi:MAG: hypothetical protein Fur0042_12560 [Cyanophyceae cyanobacterium]
MSQSKNTVPDGKRSRVPIYLGTVSVKRKDGSKTVNAIGYAAAHVVDKLELKVATFAQMKNDKGISRGSRHGKVITTDNPEQGKLYMRFLVPSYLTLEQLAKQLAPTKVNRFKVKGVWYPCAGEEDKAQKDQIETAQEATKASKKKGK